MTVEAGSRPTSRRVFLPLVPYVALLLVLHVLLRPLGVAWLAWLIVAAVMSGVIFYVWWCGRRAR